MARRFWVNRAEISLEDFNLSEKDGRTLITPVKSKHTWAPNELHLRSLLLDADGYVLSSGFCKFVNIGEIPDHDFSLLEAMKGNGSVTYSAKEDGSLVIASLIDGQPHYRTRGSHNLGIFEEPVMSLVYDKYPMVEVVLKHFGDNPRKVPMSFLFEYTAPTNQIVLKYGEPDLHFLGVMRLDTLHLSRVDISKFSAIANAGGEGKRFFPKAAVFHDLPKNPADLIKEVRSWVGKEGIVARIVLPEQDPVTGPVRLLKCKSDLYVKLHSLRFRLGGKVGKLAFLLGIESLAEAPAKLETLGIDFEAQQFIQAELEEYCEKLLYAQVAYGKFLGVCELIKENTLRDDLRTSRRNFVETVQEYIHVNDLPASFFGASMAWYSQKGADGWTHVVAAEVLDESAGTVKTWAITKDAILNEMLHTPVDDDQ